MLLRTITSRSDPLQGRLPFLPGLDGIRAIAVAAVFLYHAEVVWMPGGFLGVEVFFVLSGYLITSMLWGSFRVRHTLDLTDFYKRRARRLLPAVAGLLLFVTTVAVLWWPEEVGRIRGDVLAALTYVSNWYQIVTQQSYFASLGRPSPFRHLWSLAIEEQFYLLWPIILLVALRRGRRTALAVTAGLAAVSMASMAATFSLASPSRAYFGTDTRAFGLLIGAALALTWRPFEGGDRSARIPGWALDIGTWLSLGVIGWMCVRAEESTASTFVPGIGVTAVATALLIAVTVHPKTQSSLFLSWRWMRWLGRRSYSIYLWHWPIFVVTRPGVDVTWSPGVALLVRTALTLALSEASYRWIEDPIRNGAIQRARDVIAFRIRYNPSLRPVLVRRWAAVGAGGLVIVLGLTASVIAAPAPQPDPLEIALREAAAEGTDEPPVQASVEPEPTPSVATPKTRSVPSIPAFKLKAIAIGDSVMLGAKKSLKAQFKGVYVNAAVSRQTHDGIALLKKWRKEDRLTDTVIVHFGNNGAFTRAQFDEMMRVLRPVERVVVVTVKVPRRWQTNVNKTITEGARRYPKVTIADWNRRYPRCKGKGIFAADGFHLTPVGARCYADVIAGAYLAAV